MHGSTSQRQSKEVMTQFDNRHKKPKDQHGEHTKKAGGKFAPQPAVHKLLVDSIAETQNSCPQRKLRTLSIHGIYTVGSTCQVPRLNLRAAPYEHIIKTLPCKRSTKKPFHTIRALVHQCAHPPRYTTMKHRLENGASARKTMNTMTQHAQA